MTALDKSKKSSVASLDFLLLSKAMVETQQHNEPSFGEGLEVLLQAEAEEGTRRRFERLKKSAQFRYQATIEELNLETSRGINKHQS